MNRLGLKTSIFSAAICVALGAMSTAALADNAELRVATLAPPGSSWMKILDRGSAELDKATSSRVKIKYYSGGVQGDEKDVIRKIRLGQLDGASVTAVGLGMIDESIRVLELPRMFDSLEELDYVRDRMWPYFQKKFAKKGFRLGDAGDVGWVYFLSQSKVESIDDLRKTKAWMWGDDQIVRAMYKKLNISGVPLGVPEVLAGLTSGRINAAYGSALAAVALQWNTKVKFMTSMPMSYGLGATVVALPVWEKISEADRKTIEKVSKVQSTKLRRTIRKDNESAKKQMMSKGVSLVTSSPAMIADFTAAAQATWKELAGKVYSQAELDMVIKYRDEFRAKKK